MSKVKTKKSLPSASDANKVKKHLYKSAKQDFKDAFTMPAANKNGKYNVITDAFKRGGKMASAIGKATLGALSGQYEAAAKRDENRKTITDRIHYLNSKEERMKNSPSKRKAKQNTITIDSKRTNHEEWYLNYPLDGLVNLNFGIRKGAELDLVDQNRDYPVVSAAGLNTYLVKPQTKVDAWNQAINYMYSTIRSANSGATNYSPVDLERYVMTARAIHAGQASLVRAYKLLTNINFYDAHTPEYYFRAIGLDFNSFKQQAANLKDYVNRVGVMIERLVPLHISLFDRTRWLFSYGFNDSNDAKASTYFFKCTGVSYWSNESNFFVTTKFAGLTGYDSDVLDYTTLTNTMNTLLADYTSNNKFSIIAGDILKAFGEQAIYKAELIGDASVENICTYDEAVLSQIQNASMGLAGEILNYTFAFTDDSLLTETHSISRSDGRPGSWLSDFLPDPVNKVINSNKNNVSAGEAISLTRLVAQFTATATSTKLTFDYTVCGTEIITCMDVVANIKSLPGATISIGGYNYGDIPNAALTYSGPAAIPCVWAQLDYAPIITGAYSDSVTDTQPTMYYMPLIDLNNYALISSQGQLSQFHEYAVLSMLAIPNVIKQNSVTLIG